MVAFRHIALALAALFLLMQGLSAAHVAQFGVDHEHEGVACELALQAEDESDAMVPPLGAEPAFIDTPVDAASVSFADAILSFDRARAPPSRGPPA